VIDPHWLTPPLNLRQLLGSTSCETKLPAVSARTAHNPDRTGAEKLRQPVMLPASRVAEMAQRGHIQEE